MKIKFTLLALMVFTACQWSHQSTDTTKQDNFVKVDEGRLVLNGQPYNYVGTNFWYGAILGSEGQGGDRQRLNEELDTLKALGLTNLRILVGSDGKGGVPAKVEPTLQVEPGVYNDTILDGLDYLLNEMAKRDMKAVLYINNSWEWSGGYGMYLEWAGAGKAPAPSIDGYGKFMSFVAQFSVNEKAQQLFYNHVRNIVSRTNRYTKVKYTDDPTIMSWQIGNEPRAFSIDPTADQTPHKAAFAAWLAKTSKLIKQLDHNHLVSVGSEGKHGCEEDIELFRTIHADPNIDYTCIHIWPFNWSWINKETVTENLQIAKDSTYAYIQEHHKVAEQIGKPVVLEEFGYPRDGFQFSKTSATDARDSYYDYVFQLVMGDEFPLLNGCNFWGWGGLANPANLRWQPYDEYTGDPAQEEQGLNSVFASDTTTLKVIKRHMR
jgi:mannan endo-1,4-beta-mannosidase